MSDIQSIIGELEALLDYEEASSMPTARYAYDDALQRREILMQAVKQFRDYVVTLEQRVGNLPRLAPLGFVQWAEAVLKLPNLVFLVIDTTGVRRNADIIRVLVMDRDGVIEHDSIIRPVRDEGQANTAYTGISYEQIIASDTIKEQWDGIRRALEGKYVLCYSLDWVQERLDENARAYDLSGLRLVGDCLMHTAEQYFSQQYLKLQHAAYRIGHELGSYPSAEERAQAQRALLKAMAQGITSAPPPTPVDEDEDQLGDIDDGPF